MFLQSAAAEVLKIDHLSSTFALKWPKVLDRWPKLASGAKFSVCGFRNPKYAIRHTLFASAEAESRQA